MDRGSIIKDVLLKLGENTIYNDNKSDIYVTCGEQLDSVVNNIAYSSAFLFNAVTVELTNYGKVDDEYRFNKPIDCLNILRANNDYRLENEFIYSTSDKIKIQYCRRIDLSEIPDNLFNLIVAMTARKMAFAYNTYRKSLELLINEVTLLKNDVVSQQGFQFWGDE